MYEDLTLNKIFKILGLSLVFYWMMPKKCEKRTIKSRAFVPLSTQMVQNGGGSQDVNVVVHYEMYDGLPLTAKWIEASVCVY